MAGPRTVALVAALLAGSLTACTSTTEGDARDAELLPDTVVEAADQEIDGAIAGAVDLEDAEVWVGSPIPSGGDATPQLLAALTVQALEAAGAKVHDASDLGGGFLVRDSLVSGEVDVSWEGTGEAWTAILRQPGEGLDAQTIHDDLAARDLDENGVVWLDAADFAAGPRFAVADDVARSDGLATMSDMAERLEQDDEALVCVTQAFNTFPNDGRVEVEPALGIELDEERTREYDPEPIYPETADGTCLFGLVQSTSGRLPEYGLTVLEDDVGAFLPDSPAPAVREDLLVEHPEVATVLNALSARLDAEGIRDMNQRVLTDDVDPQVVAREWLEAQGLVPQDEGSGGDAE